MDLSNLFFIDSAGNLTCKSVIDNRQSLDKSPFTTQRTHIFKKKSCADPHSLALVQLFKGDPNKEPAIIAFGLKPTGKFYHFFNERPYDEIEGASEFALGGLTYFSAVVTGKSNDHIMISGGIKDGEYQTACLLF